MGLNIGRFWFGQLLITHKINVERKITRCHFCVILYFPFTSCSTSFGQPCAHLQELTTA